MVQIYAGDISIIIDGRYIVIQVYIDIAPPPEVYFSIFFRYPDSQDIDSAKILNTIRYNPQLLNEKLLSLNCCIPDPIGNKLAKKYHRLGLTAKITWS